jgi:hypothetical protein
VEGDRGAEGLLDLIEDLLPGHVASLHA